MAKDKRPSYFKLGKDASTFYCPTSGLNINNHQVVKFTGKETERIRIGVSHGHIIEVDEDEYNKYSDIQTKKAEKKEAIKQGKIQDEDEDESGAPGDVKTKHPLPDFNSMTRDSVEEWAEEHLDFGDDDDKQAFMDKLSSTGKKVNVIKLITKHYEEN